MQLVPPRRTETNESGAILPITALMIVLLLVFAAFAVDLGSAWAQRREAQTAADAGAMAGILAAGDIVTDAIDYVELNVSDSSPLDWFSCPTPDPMFSSFTDDGGNSLDFVLVDGDRTNCVWISTGVTSENSTYVAVRTPNIPVETAFAGLIGIDTIDIDAAAISRIAKPGKSAILPFALPAGATGQVCLGSAPAGVARYPCFGATSGNFGYISSPNHGVDTTYGTENSCDGQPNALAVLENNLALGADHLMVTEFEVDYLADPATANADYPDECNGKIPPLYVPNSVVTLTGNAEDQMHAGLVSNATFGLLDRPSRLQLPVSIPASATLSPMNPTRTILGPKSDSTYTGLDNVGLWEYIKFGSGKCAPNHTDFLAGGPEATDQLFECLGSDDAATLIFDTALRDSPRFGVVPQLWEGFPSGTKAMAIKQFRPVYLMGAWFNCNASGTADACVQFEDITSIAGSSMQPIFFPGEGNEDACYDGSPKCKTTAISGLTALTLPLPTDINGVVTFGPDADDPGEAELVR